MKVKAKWAVKVNGTWRKTGDVFEVDSTDELLDAVEVLEGEQSQSTVKTEDADSEKEEPNAETKDEPQPKTAARTRRKITEK